MKTVVMIPTYNEATNIKLVIEDVLNCGADVDVLVVDDMSPDKTYKIVEELSKINNKIHILLRKEKKGRGYAGKDGFLEALNMGADYIIEMDGDGSHSPKYIPGFLKAIQHCDVVIGSRYVNGGKDEERSLIRQFVSNFSRRYLSFVLGVEIQDPTSGYRMFQRGALSKFASELTANDPFIVAEVLYKIKKNNLKVIECPVVFLARFSGKSKLHLGILIIYLFKVLKLRLTGK